MDYAARTDVGLKRFNNEDSYIINVEKDEKIFIVADGMGGHNAGEVASLTACRTVENSILDSKGDIDAILKEAVEKANKEIFIKAAENTEMKGMGTTVEACVLTEDIIHLAHVGDSRVYVINSDEIRKITNDHSIVGMMLDNGTITEEEAKYHPQRHFITRAVGTSMTVEVDIVNEKIHKGEWVLMCTDGLTNMVPKDEIHRIVVSSSKCEKAAEKLIEKAKENGGDDNITLILFNLDKGKRRNRQL